MIHSSTEALQKSNWDYKYQLHFENTNAQMKIFKNGLQLPLGFYGTVEEVALLSLQNTHKIQLARVWWSMDRNQLEDIKSKQVVLA